MKFYSIAAVVACGLPACSSNEASSPTAGSAGASAADSGRGGTDVAGGSAGVGTAGSEVVGGGGTAAGNDQGTPADAAATGEAGGSAGSVAAGFDASVASDSGAAATGRVDAASAREGGNGIDAASDAAGVGDAGRAGDAGALALMSSGFTEGMTIPTEFTCAGVNTSPALAWSGGPSDAQSYALVFTDANNSVNHWVLWDLPPTVMSIPASLMPSMLPPGALESSIGTNGAYSGPCPGGPLHRYIFQLYALNVAKLPNVTANTPRPNLVTAIKAHQLVVPATLSGTSTARRP